MPRIRPIVSVYLDAETLRSLDCLAERERRSRSNLVGALVAEGLLRRVAATSDAPAEGLRKT